MSAGATSAPGAPRELFIATSQALMARLAVLDSPVRTAREVVQGCLSAPAGRLAAAFCHIDALDKLIEWEKVLAARMRRVAAQTAASAAAVATSTGGMAACRPLPAYGSGGGGGGVSSAGAKAQSGCGDIGREALDLYREVVLQHVRKHDGYVVATSSSGGNWVLAFRCAENAVLWGLSVLEALLDVAWPEGLLESEHTEEIWEGKFHVCDGIQ